MQSVAGSQWIGVVTDVGSDSPAPVAAIAEKNRQRVVGVSRLNPGRGDDFSALKFKVDYRSVVQAHALGHGEADHDRIVPGQFREWLGDLLQPSVIGEAAVIDRRIRPDDELDALVCSL